MVPSRKNPSIVLAFDHCLAGNRKMGFIDCPRGNDQRWSPEMTWATIEEVQ